MTQSINVKRDKAILDITLDRAENGNLITEELSGALARLLDEVGPDVKLVRLQANGDDFCRGRQSPSINRATATALEFREKIAAGPLRLYDSFVNCRAPILGLVQGQAFGVGCALAALCDITIASENALFCIPEMTHSIPPTLVVSALADKVPQKAISYLVYSRAKISAARAEALGIVSLVVAQEDLASAGRQMSETMLGSTVESLHGVKEFIRSAASVDARSRATLASTIIATVQASQNRAPSPG